MSGYGARHSPRRHIAFLAAFLAVQSADKALAQPIADDPVHAFAIAALERVQAASIRDDREYCGFIGRDKSGRLIATPAARGKERGCHLSKKPRGLTPIATYHTHGAHNRSTDSEAPSIQDLRRDFKAGVDGYIATPGGRIWFNDHRLRHSRLLCGPGCIETDIHYRDCERTRPRTLYTIETLKWRAHYINDPC